MSLPTDNPYRASNVEGDAGPVTGRLEYRQCFRFIWDSPNWILNVLFLTISQMIPVIGYLIVMGYQFEVVESLHRSPKTPYPDFDFNRFIDYLKRGVWPFLVSLAVSLVLSPLSVLLVFCAIGLVALVQSVAGEGEAAFFIIVVPLLIMAYIVLIAGIHLLVLPFQLRAGLQQDFWGAFDFAFVKTFVRLVWREILLGMLFLMFASFVLMVVGMALFCVGIYLTIPLVMLAQAHLFFQLYQLYLARGGKPVPLREPEVFAPVYPA